MTSGEGRRNKRAIPALAIIQGVAAIGGMMIKGINAPLNAAKKNINIQKKEKVNYNKEAEI